MKNFIFRFYLALFISESFSGNISIGDAQYSSNPKYPEVAGVAYSASGANISLADGSKIFQSFDRIYWRNDPQIWIYRANIDSVFIPKDTLVYPSLYYTVDSILYGGSDFIGYKDSLDVRGDRLLSTYPKDYWYSYKNLKILVGSGYNKYFEKRIPPTAYYMTTHREDFNDLWYFSQRDTLWNDYAVYGKPRILDGYIDSLRADSIRLANTPVLSTPTVTAEPVELWSLSGENLWSGRDWRKSGLPTGVYLLKNRDAQRVVWVE